MHAYPSKMREIGGRLGTIAGEARTNVGEAADGVAKAGTGNEGFTTVGAAAKAAADWTGHVRTVAGHVDDAGLGLVKAANDIAGTDADNERGMPVVPG